MLIALGALFTLALLILLGLVARKFLSVGNALKQPNEKITATLGTPKSKCTSMGDRSIREDFTMASGKAHFAATIFFTGDCQGEGAYRAETSPSFAMRGGVKSDLSAGLLELTLGEIKVTPLSAAAQAKANADRWCGLSGWKKGTGQEVPPNCEQAALLQPGYIVDLSSFH